MEFLGYIIPWVLASVLAGVVAGYLLSRTRGRGEEAQTAERDRQATLKVLVDLLQSVEQVSGDVECRNSEIQKTADHVGAMHVSGEMEPVKQTLLEHMVHLLQSNQRLHEDLLCTRYRMEEQAQEIDHARREARTDGLTSVANRKALDEKLHVLMADWKREGRPFVLMMIDVDHLKRINDCHGHQAGDQVLEWVGHQLKECTRDGDFAGRYGGDEFAVLLPQTDLPAGMELAESICSRTGERASRITFRGEQVSVSLSIGVAAAAPDDTIESLVRRADEALYRCKRLGRNQVQCQEDVREAELVGAASG